mgnify:CR=1 FL=1
MCAPMLSASAMFAASLAVSAVTGVVQYVGQQQAAQAQYDAQVTNAENGRNAAIADMIQKSADINSREEQERAAVGLRNMNASEETRRAAATAMATSESAGLSFDALLADYDQQYLSYADAQMQQLGFNVEQLQRNREGIEAEAESRINTIPMQPVTFPGFASTLLGIGGQALGAYDTFSVRDPLTGQRTLT